MSFLITTPITTSLCSITAYPTDLACGAIAESVRRLQGQPEVDASMTVMDPYKNAGLFESRIEEKPALCFLDSLSEAR